VSSRVVLIFAAACALFAMPGASLSAPASGDAALSALAIDYYRAEWKFSPTTATGTGVHDYDAQLDPVTPAAIQAEIAHLHRTLAALEALDLPSLSFDGQVDEKILDASIKTNLYQLEQRAIWQSDPGYYTGIGAGGVYAIISRSFAPASKRLTLAIDREAQLPGLMRQAEKNIVPSKVPAIVANVAELDAQGSVDFLSTDVPQAFAGVHDAALQARFKTVNAAGIAAFKEYAAFIHTKVAPKAHAPYAIGAADYRRLEQLQNIEDIPLDKLLTIGEARLARDKADFLAAAKQIDPTKTPTQLLDALQRDHPTNAQLLSVAQSQLAQLVAFIKTKHIIDLPNAPLAKVVKTPLFAAQTSFASMNSPGPLETVATEAYYNVTVADPKWPADRTAQHLAFYTPYRMLIISSHEAYPGHYTNYLFNKEHDLSLIRKIEWNVAFGEGWAHYDEQMMVDEGLGGGNPRYRLFQLSAALWRDCRYIVGIEEHTQGMTVDQATKFFMDNAFQAREPAYREAVRGTMDPLYGYYTLGKLMILKLRDDYKAKTGADYSLAKFHDELLSHGDPPIYFLRKYLLGQDDKGSLL
jgi:uncharacterized protein (DUF885 family)